VSGGRYVHHKGSKAAREEIENRGKVEEVIDFSNFRRPEISLSSTSLTELENLWSWPRLSPQPELILLDEPSAGMNMEEKEI